MHGFWRGTIAIAGGLVFWGWYGPNLGQKTAHTIYTLLRPVREMTGMEHDITFRIGSAMVDLPVLLFAFFIYAILTRLWGSRRTDAETRCRKCHHILRGISEPRCPECGERI